MASNPLFSQLKRLSLKSCNFGTDGLRALVTSPHLSKLKRIDLSGNNLTVTDLELIGTSTCLRSLEWISCSDQSVIDGHEASAIIDGPVFANATKLKLSNVTKDACDYLVTSMKSDNLKVLSLRHSKISMLAASHLVKFKNLTKLTVTNYHLDDGAKFLQSHFSNLKRC